MLAISVSKPLSYQSLKSVVVHMEANRRFLLVSLIPSLRNIHQVTPLKIDYLKFEETQLTVNSCVHSFKSIIEPSHYDGFLSEEAQLSNANGGASHDVDRHGNREEEPALSGSDVLIGYSPPAPPVRILNSGPEWEHRSHIRYAFCAGIKGLNKFQVKLPYGLKIRDVIRKYIDNFFGRKYQIPVVKRLDGSHGTLRFPTGFKIKIQELKVDQDLVIAGLKPLLDSSSFPLKKISVQADSPSDSIFENLILKSSEFLEIISDNTDITWNMNLSYFTNRIISFSNIKLLSSNLIDFAQNLIESPKEIGTKMTCAAENGKLILEKFEKQLRVESGLVTIENSAPIKCAVIQLNEASELILYSLERSNDNRQIPWRVTMEVAQSGTAKRSD